MTPMPATPFAEQHPKCSALSLSGCYPKHCKDSKMFTN